ncbi:MAG TPA: HDIG domain-containing protein [Thermomicrobiaceae bacterium]|nr:HDIG domain-containing protein [Thermomicrobiaceae bacterium]
MTSVPSSRAERRIDRANWLVRRITPSSVVLRQLLGLALFALATVGILTAVLYLTWSTDSTVLQVGEIANRTIKAPRTATFVSTTLTQQQRQEAYDDSRNVVLTPDPSVAPTQMSALQQALLTIDEAKSVGTPGTSNVIDQIRGAVPGLSAGDAGSIAALGPNAWKQVETEAQRLLDTTLSAQIRSEDVASVRQQLSQHASMLLTPSEQQLAVALASPFVRSNVTVNAAKTLAAREAASAAVPPVTVTVQRGQVIIRDGDPVTKSVLETLNYFQLLQPSQNWEQFIGTVGLLVFVTLALVAYLYKSPHGLWQGRHLLLVGVVVLVPVIAGRFLLPNSELRYIFPTAAAAMLLAILLDFQVAAVVGGIIALYLGVIAGTSFDVTFVAFVSSLAGAAIIWRAERVMTFVWAALAVAVTTTVGAILFTMLAGSIDLATAGSLLAAGALNGVLSASLTFLSFSLFGRLFGITTHLQLLELAHPNQPLLYRLAREAPGTYHHSIVVSNLAESAVEVVGGDPLFARVAVLYHDVGKVLRPSFFVENQANRANVHDALDPRTSARIIVEHVLDGVRLARKARLPRSIIDVIEQHHGTTLIRYFYNQAVNSGEEVDEAEFRYPGPKPKTKEAGVIMLADSVEAAVRASAQSGKLFEEAKGADPHGRSGKLADIVDGVIRDRLAEGQLDQCDLTLKQIEQVRQTFISILEGIYHPRIEYPELNRNGARQPAPNPQATAVEVSS